MSAPEIPFLAGLDAPAAFQMRAGGHGAYRRAPCAMDVLKTRGWERNDGAGFVGRPARDDRRGGSGVSAPEIP
ncbi:hypothetical protein CTI14_61230, partial [Methylobacterium radiotolerans]